MKSLNEIWPEGNVRGDVNVSIKGLAFDSRKVNSGDAYFAIVGLTTDGHFYIEQSIKNGATVIFCQQWPDHMQAQITYVKVDDSSKVMAQIAHKFFDKPSTHLKLVGVTGTNGKTTTVSLLFQLFNKLGYKAGLISTIECRIGNEILPSDYTTPDSIAINRLLGQMLEAGCDYVFMEVSSHAVKQNRIEALDFAGGIFTNMSHDHLDYHKTFDDYILQKKRFFDGLASSSFALINVDDKRGEVMVQNTKAKVSRYSLQRMADYRGRILSNSIYGLQVQFNNDEFHSQLIGRFNAYNLLAVYGATFLLGAGPDIAIEMSLLIPAAGRMERVNMPSKNAIAFIDYAHTPDALKNILLTIQEVKSSKAELICVVGCGGNRDKAKRPKMASIASRLSDWVIFTSDNPRDEDPDTIIKDMERGIPQEFISKTLSITDRKQAIKAAYRMASRNSVVVIAGKGHEPYQEIAGVKHPFDDKKIILELSNEDI